MLFRSGTVKNPKNTRLYVRFRRDEKQRVSGEAKKAGLTMSEYVRRRALGLAVKSRVSEQAINELRQKQIDAVKNDDERSMIMPRD